MAGPPPQTGTREVDWDQDVDIIMGILFKWVEAMFSTSPTVAAGFTAFMLSSLIYLVTGILSRLFFKTYRDMALKDQHRWNSGVNRALGALMLATRGMSALLQGVPDDGFVWGSTPYLERTSAFALGFFLFEVRDSLNMYLAHGIFEETLVVHHAFGVILYTVSLAGQAYHFAVAVVLIQEFCAPMVHFGWVLTKLGLGNHWLWDVNQYLLIAGWCVCRIGVDIVLWYHFLANTFEIIYGPTLPMLLNVSLLGLLSFVLNPYWLMMKIRQFKNRDMKYIKQQTAVATAASAATGTPPKAQKID